VSEYLVILRSEGEMSGLLDRDANADTIGAPQSSSSYADGPTRVFHVTPLQQCLIARGIASCA
jgi:hypothetical protein